MNNDPMRPWEDHPASTVVAISGANQAHAQAERPRSSLWGGGFVDPGPLLRAEEGPGKDKLRQLLKFGAFATSASEAFLELGRDIKESRLAIGTLAAAGAAWSRTGAVRNRRPPTFSRPLRRAPTAMMEERRRWPFRSPRPRR